MRESLRLLCLGTVIVMTGCGPLDNQRSTPPTATQAPVRDESQLESLWVRDGLGGGFARADLSEAPSLYVTAWNLRLANVYQVAIPKLNRKITATWLQSTIDLAGA